MGFDLILKTVQGQINVTQIYSHFIKLYCEIRKEKKQLICLP
ncbi:hypothetical protein D1AOALGA4SA_11854 [Olavius algarvensis Delta 1 endosymbiont]|nr:hypothetical protein D1AOALGA4SA_11854 [Olavius algarvensis Delta 1 endosymbiont]